MAVDVSAARVPLANTAETDAAATLVIGGVDAAPGPVLASVLGTLRQIQKMAGRPAGSEADRLFFPAQQVQIRVVGGRVTHDRLEVRVGGERGMVLITSGSVGFDDSVALNIEIPRPGELVSGRLSKLGQTGPLNIPISGTVARPVPDLRFLQGLVSQGAAGAAEKALERPFERALGKPLSRLLDRSESN